MDVTEAMTSWKYSLNRFVPGPIQKIGSECGHDHLHIKRLDLIQSWADGNKYYKLKKNIAFALESGIETIVSKGGMFSNHLYSLAHACSDFGLKLVCGVRSFGPDPGNPVLNDLKALSHEILLLTPERYNKFDQEEASVLYPGSYFIPEGGLNDKAIQGSMQILEECREHSFTHIIISGGTMTTACGIMAAAPASVKVIIVPAWKGCTNQYLTNVFGTYNTSPQCSWELWTDAHFGGFAKYNPELPAFMNSFTRETGIPLDPVYTGKMIFALLEKIKHGYFTPSDSILAIHTGGIQGLRGFKYRYPGDWSEYSDLLSKRG